MHRGRKLASYEIGQVRGAAVFWGFSDEASSTLKKPWCSLMRGTRYLTQITEYPNYQPYQLLDNSRMIQVAGPFLSNHTYLYIYMYMYILNIDDGALCRFILTISPVWLSLSLVRDLIYPKVDNYGQII